MAGSEVVLDADYYIDHAEEFEALTEDERTQLLLGNAITPKGDTLDANADANADADGKEKENAAAPDADKDKVDNDADGQAEVDKKETVIQAKDGVHTIPFSELEKARTDTDHWIKVAAEQAALIESLKAAKVEDEAAGDTKASEAVMGKLKEDFPELAETLGPVMKSMIETGVKQHVSALEKKLDDALAPLQKSSLDIVRDKHFQAIENAHPDYGKVLDSAEFKTWKDKQPSFVRQQIDLILAGDEEKGLGTASQIIELVTTFKTANPVKQEEKKDELTAAQLAANALEAEKKAKGGTPASLSDVPAGSKAHHDEAEAMLDMSNQDLATRFAGKTPAEIEKLISSVV